jgi:hypothetical protein
MRSLIPLTLGILTFSFAAQSQVSINGSYYNITHPGGSTVSPGDILEIHSVIAVNSGTTVGPLSFNALIPTGTTYVAGSLSVRTNEDVVAGTVINTGNYTDATGDDRGSITGSAITIYMGDGATPTSGGSVTGGTTQPRFFTAASFLMAVFEVKVAMAPGNVITTNGTFNYKIGAAVFHTSITPIQMKISYNTGCSGNGAVNYLTDENGGTFGSGNTQNRAASTNVPGYTYATLNANQPADGNYSVVNNNSPTVYTGASPAGTDKVFGVWDVCGDHTGTGTAAGNSPTASGATGGYFLAVNGTYVPATTFHTVINGLIATNSFTVTFWVRNICPLCGCDPSTGNNNNTPGVQPNLGISINGFNYYSSGNIAYSNGWVQKSFTIPSLGSTTATVDITNNAPGGGGNDFMLDDINMKQCLIVLPVGLESFTGHAGPQGNLLRWTTSFAADIQYFDIERSADGQQFTPIGQVAANADTSSYSYTDGFLPAESETFYYRLSILDLNGKPAYSNIVRIAGGNSTGGLVATLAPNPTHNGSMLSLQAPDAGQAQVTVLNSAGAILWSRESTLPGGNATSTIQLPATLPRGIYLVKTTMGDASAVVRLVVE